MPALNEILGLADNTCRMAGSIFRPATCNLAAGGMRNLRTALAMIGVQIVQEAVA